MAGKAAYDYGALLEKAKVLLANDPSIKSLSDIADALGVNSNTLFSGFRKLKISKLEDIRKQIGATEMKIAGDEGDKIELEFNGNFGEVRAVDVRGQIRTVAQLLKAAQVDLKEWEPFEPTVKKWDVALKLKTGDVDIVQVVPSFYVATKLKRIVPLAFEPVVSPVQLQVVYKKPTQDD